MFPGSRWNRQCQAKETTLKIHRGLERLQKNWSPELSLFHAVLEAQKITNFHQNYVLEGQGKNAI